MLLWVLLFALLNSIAFLFDHWHYPAIMVLGAFVAGLTPDRHLSFSPGPR